MTARGEGRTTVVQCAWAAVKKKDSYLQAQFFTRRGCRHRLWMARTNVSSYACAMSAAGSRLTSVLPGGACEGSEGFLSRNRSRAQIAMLTSRAGPGLEEGKHGRKTTA
jgi:hypothetical protein